MSSRISLGRFFLSPAESFILQIQEIFTRYCIAGGYAVLSRCEATFINAAQKTAIHVDSPMYPMMHSVHARRVSRNEIGAHSFESVELCLLAPWLGLQLSTCDLSLHSHQLCRRTVLSNVEENCYVTFSNSIQV